MSWRRLCEASFRFNPALGVDPLDLAAIENEIRKGEAALAGAISAATARLQAASHLIFERRETIGAMILTAQTQVAQAEADLAALT
jgi:hypothetical protein